MTSCRLELDNFQACKLVKACSPWTSAIPERGLDFAAPGCRLLQKCRSRTGGVVTHGNADFVERLQIQLFRGILDGFLTFCAWREIRILVRGVFQFIKFRSLCWARIGIYFAPGLAWRSLFHNLRHPCCENTNFRDGLRERKPFVL